MDFHEKRKQYRKGFPIIEKEIWLNHAGHAPWSLPSLKAMDEFARSFAYGPMRPYEDWDAVRDKTRELLAKLLNAETYEIGFNFTTSLALSMISHAIHWERGDNAIAPDKSFPSIVMPVKLLEQWDVEGRIVETVDGLISEDKLIEAIDGRTKLMIVPLVNFLTGQRLDVKRISKACREKGVFLVVDAIQAVGPMKVDVKDLDCHALCFGSLKWMFGPMGVGTVYINGDDLDKLKIVQVGMVSMPNEWDFFDYDQDIKKEACRYECGCASDIAHHGMKPNLEMFLDLGPENIEKYLLELTGYLHDELTSGGVKVLTPREDERRAAIVTFDAKSAGWDNAQALLEALTREHITVSLRMGLVRVSPHFYNSREEIDKLLDVVLGR